MPPEESHSPRELPPPAAVRLQAPNSMGNDARHQDSSAHRIFSAADASVLSFYSSDYPATQQAPAPVNPAVRLQDGGTFPDSIETSRSISPSSIAPPVPPDGRLDSRQGVPGLDHSDTVSPSHEHDLHLPRKPSMTDSTTSGGEEPWSVARQSPAEFRAEPARPDLKSDQGRMCVAVDFGTVLSGVACGVSSSTVEQIMWPGSNRKVPTCLVYDATGHVAAWGLKAQTVKLETGWIRCEMWFDCTFLASTV